MNAEDVQSAGVPEGKATELALDLGREMRDRGYSDESALGKIREILENPAEGFLRGPWEAQVFAQEIWNLKRTGRFTTEGI